MAKDKASKVWHKAIKCIGNGYIELVCQCTDQLGDVFAGHGMGVSVTAGNLCVFVTADPDYNCNIIVAEDIVTGDRYFLGRKKGASILHNQKLGGAYQIGAAVYKSAAGTWTQAAHGVGQSLLMEVGIVVGPADRITSSAVKDIDVALTATEPVDICI